MGRNVILEEQTLEFSYHSGYGAYWAMVVSSPFFTEGQEYIIVWDGTEYTRTAFGFTNPLDSTVCVAAGNTLVTGGENNGDPFAIVCDMTNNYIHYFSLETTASHSIAVFQTEPETEKNGIILKDRAGNDIVYQDKYSIFIPDTSGGLTEFFTGKKVEKTIDPDFSEGNMEIAAEAGTFLEKVTVNKPEALLPENIREGENVAGITGTLPAYEITDKTVALDFSGGDMNITPEDGKAFGNVNIPRPAMLIPNNIVKDIEIAGVTGTFEGGSGDNFEADIISNTLSGDYYNPSVSTVPMYKMQNMRSLTGVSFPMCSSIANNGFYNCSNLKTISFPECTYIGSNAFRYCYSLETAVFPKCSRIESYAFDNCSALTTASFSECKTIGYYAFGSCVKLHSLSFPACTTISSYAFQFGSYGAFDTADFPECTSMGIGAFFKCSYLGGAKFPKLTIIPSSAFCSCFYLGWFGGLTFPATTTVYNSAFYNGNGIYSITSQTFPNLQTIYSSAFRACNGLSYANFPKARLFYNYAFAYCSKLATLVIPSCSSIYASAFAYCSSLTSVYLLGSVYASLAATGVFYGTPLSNSTLTGAYGSFFVRESMLASYKTRAYWSYFSNRFVGLTDDEIAALGEFE